MQRVTIIGLGLIGGSIGLGLRRWSEANGKGGGTALEVIGFDTDLEQQNYAKKIKAVDRAEWELAKAVRDADIVVVCTPVAAMEETFTNIAPHLKAGAIVTDTGSTKAQVLAWAEQLLPRTVEFIGGHPLVGIGGTSIRDASADALRDSIYCLVPASWTGRAALDGIEALVTAIGAKPYYMDAAEHDSYVAAGAHLPLAVAIALMETVSRGGGWREIQPIAGEALLQMTELSSAEPDTSGEALISNAPALTHWLDRMIETLAGMRDDLQEPAGFQALLERTREAREHWLLTQPNVRPGEDAFHRDMAEVERPSVTGLFFGRRTFRDRGKSR